MAVVTIMGHIGIIGFYWGCIGIMEKKMETTILRGLYKEILSFEVTKQQSGAPSA